MQINTPILLAAAWIALSSATTAISADSTTLKPAAVPRAVIREVDPAAAEKLLSESKAIVLDVRTPKEFREGHIKGATNLNFNARSFEQELATLDKSRPYLVHCAVGGRSSKAVKKMEQLGFTNIYHLESGMKGWERAGKPVVKD